MADHKIVTQGNRIFWEQKARSLYSATEKNYARWDNKGAFQSKISNFTAPLPQCKIPSINFSCVVSSPLF